MPDAYVVRMSKCPASTCSVKMAESVVQTHPEPEAEPGAGTSLSCSDSSKSSHNLLLKS